MEFLKTKKFIWLAAVVWALLILALSYWKYAHNLFNGLDLAIYNQAMHNSLNGQIMQLSIHPHSYFGDHFEPILFLLLPFYALVQHPLTLVLLQTLMIAVTVWPIYKLSQKFLPNYWPTIIALSWLLNPFVHTAATFEFHALIFSACLLIWALYFYQLEKFVPWLITIALVLISREDAALSVIAFSFIAWFDKKHWRWYLPTLIVAILYFVFSLKIISYYAPESHYKFISYYQWLGETQKEIIINALTHPWLLLAKLFRWQNFILFFTLLMPTGFVALYRPKWLLLSVPAFLGYALTGSNSVSVILATHYAVILLPGYFLATLFALKAILSKLEDNHSLYLPVFKIIVGVSIVYSVFTIGLGKVLYEINFSDYQYNLKENNLIVKKNESIVAPFGLLTYYSYLNKLYSLNYLLTGHKQLSLQPFITPKTDWLAINNADMIYFSATKPASSQWKLWWESLDDNLRNRVNEMFLTKLTPAVAYFSNTISDLKLVDISNTPATQLKAELVNSINLSDDHVISLTVTCQQSENNKVINIRAQLNSSEIYDYNVPYLWGLYRAKDCVEPTTYTQLIALPKNTSSAEISVNEVSVETKINSLGILSIVPKKISTLETTTINFSN